MPSGKKIVVVGAGIVGASIAYHLSKRGADVVLFDRGEPAGDTTGKAFGWLNFTSREAHKYPALRRSALAVYRRIEKELGPEFAVNWCGSLAWESSRAETMAYVERQTDAGFDISLIGMSQITELEPNLVELPECAAFCSEEGAVDPVLITRLLVQGAVRLGTTVRTHTVVSELVMKGTETIGVRANGDVTGADIVVVACGTATNTLTKPLGIEFPIASSPALLMRYRAPPGLVNTIVSSPGFEARQYPDSRLLCAEDFDDDCFMDDADTIATLTLAKLKKGFRHGNAIEFESIDIGYRAMPADDAPIVGFIRNLRGVYIAVMHAGVTLAPAIGDFAANEIVNGVNAVELDQCRPARFG